MCGTGVNGANDAKDGNLDRPQKVCTYLAVKFPPPFPLARPPLLSLVSPPPPSFSALPPTPPALATPPSSLSFIRTFGLTCFECTSGRRRWHRLLFIGRSSSVS